MSERAWIAFLFDPAALPGPQAEIAVYMLALVRRGVCGEA